MSISSSDSVDAQCHPDSQVLYQNWKARSCETYVSHPEKNAPCSLPLGCNQCTVLPISYNCGKVEIASEHQSDIQHQDQAFDLTTKSSSGQRDYFGNESARLAQSQAQGGQCDWNGAFRLPVPNYYTNFSSFSSYNFAPFSNERAVAQTNVGMLYQNNAELKEETEANARSLSSYEYHRRALITEATTNESGGSRFCHFGLCNKASKPHIKKPLNAFMLFMKEKRQEVVAQCTLKESATINQILGRKWHELSRDEQNRYYEMARKEKELHGKMYPGWSARDNYAIHSSARRRRNPNDAPVAKKSTKATSRSGSTVPVQANVSAVTAVTTSSSTPTSTPAPASAPVQTSTQPVYGETPNAVCLVDSSKLQQNAKSNRYGNYAATVCYPSQHYSDAYSCNTIGGATTQPMNSAIGASLFYPRYGSLPSPTGLSQFAQPPLSINQQNDDARALATGRSVYGASLVNHSPITISTSITLNSTNAISNNFTVIT